MKNCIMMMVAVFAFGVTGADLVLIGDSTLAPRPGENYYPASGSWGDALTNHFAAGSVCRNYAVGGRTVVTTLSGWEESLAGMHTGDFVIVQFGINDDAKGKLVDEAKFKETLGKFVDDIRARGAVPVLCGPVADAGYRKDAKAGTPFAINKSRETYRDYTRAVAEAKKTDFVDMTALTAAENARLGKDGAHSLYRGMWDRPDKKTGIKRPTFDTTHPNKAGAKRFAELFIAEVKARKLPISALFQRLPGGGELTVSHDSAGGAFAVTDSAAGRTWKSLPGEPCPAGVRVDWRLEGRELVVTLDAEADMPMTMLDYPRPFAAERGDRILLTQGNGFLFPAEMTDLGTDRIDFSRYPGRDMELGCFGHLSETAGYLAIIETPEDSGVRYRIGANGLRQPNVAWRDERGKFGYGRRIRYVFFKDPTPMKMALRYREEMKRKGYYLTFPEKMRARPAMAKRYAMLSGAPNVWIWEEDGDKAGFARELKALGFDNFLLQSANRHDLGVWITPEEIREMAKVPGVLPGIYDIYRDFMDPANLPLIDCVRPYWPTNAWENGDYVLKADGSLARGWGVDRKVPDGSKKRIGCALLCEGRSWPYARANLTRDLKAAPHAARLFDVVGGGLGECYNPRHPLSRRMSRVARHDFFANAEDEFGILAGTEDGNECFVNCCSYFEGTMSAPNHYRVDGGRYMWRLYDEVPDIVRRGTDPATRVPFFDMVFHGCVNLYWYWCDYNNKFPKLWHRRDLFNFVAGEPPMYFFTRESFARQKGKLAASHALATATAKATFGVPMADYRWLTADRMVQQSEFENGVVATVNFGDRPFVMADGFELAPGGHRLQK